MEAFEFELRKYEQIKQKKLQDWLSILNQFYNQLIIKIEHLSGQIDLNQMRSIDKFNCYIKIKPIEETLAYKLKIVSLIFVIEPIYNFPHLNNAFIEFHPMTKTDQMIYSDNLGSSIDERVRIPLSNIDEIVKHLETILINMTDDSTGEEECIGSIDDIYKNITDDSNRK